MLLINVHEFQVVLADPILGHILKQQVQDIGRVLGSQGDDVVALGRAQDLGQRGQVDAQGNVAVASVGSETLGLEHHGHERDVGVIHGLQGDARVIAVKVAVLDQILDGIHDLFFFPFSGMRG